MEIELKFRLEKAATKTVITALTRLPGAGARARQRLDAVYFDTATDDLRRAGLTLRVRREDGAYVQTVKGARSLAREEWNDTVASQTPDLRAGKSGRRLRQVLKAVKDDALQARFRVKVTRTTIAFLTDGAVIEAAVDIGFIHAQRGGRLPVCELELELKSGTPAMLYAFALKVVDHLNLRIEGQSKSSRGYALAAGACPAPSGIKTVPLRRGDTMATVLRDAGRIFLGQFAANMAPAETGRQEGKVEGVHQMRVALRRLRGILKSVAHLLPAEDYAWVNARFKDVLLELGPARNWDVLLETLKAAGKAAGAHRRLVAAAEAERRTAHEHAAAHMMSPRVTTTMLEIGRWFETLADAGPNVTALNVSAGAAAPVVLARAFKRLRKKSRNFGRLTTGERHSLRIAGKNLRYATELLAPLYGAKKVRTFLRRLKVAQDTLGELNDIQGAHDLLGSLVKKGGPKGALGPPAGDLLGWLDRKAPALLESAARTVQKVRKSQPFW